MIKISEFEEDKSKLENAIESDIKRKIDDQLNDPFLFTPQQRSTLLASFPKILEQAKRDYKEEQHLIPEDVYVNPALVKTITTVKNDLTNERHVIVEMSDGKTFHDKAGSAEEFMLKQSIIGNL